MKPPTEENSTLATMEAIFLWTLMSLLIAIAILGNLLVCIAIVTDETLRKLSNLFFFSLAVSDLLVASLIMPFAMVNDLTGVWYFGHDFCKLWIAADVMSCTASIINLLAISFDRYVHIKVSKPLDYMVVIIFLLLLLFIFPTDMQLWFFYLLI